MAWWNQGYNQPSNQAGYGAGNMNYRNQGQGMNPYQPYSMVPNFMSGNQMSQNNRQYPYQNQNSNMRNNGWPNQMQNQGQNNRGYNQAGRNFMPQNQMQQNQMQQNPMQNRQMQNNQMQNNQMPQQPPPGPPITFEPIDEKTLKEIQAGFAEQDRQEAARKEAARQEADKPAPKIIIPEDTILNSIQEFAQDERNASIFYRYLAGLSEFDDDRTILDEISNESTANSHAFGLLYHEFAGKEHSIAETQINTIVPYARGVRLAIEEESRALRRLSDIAETICNEKNYSKIHSLLYRKVSRLSLLHLLR